MSEHKDRKQRRDANNREKGQQPQGIDYTKYLIGAVVGAALGGGSTYFTLTKQIADLKKENDDLKRENDDLRRNSSSRRRISYDSMPLERGSGRSTRHSAPPSRRERVRTGERRSSPQRSAPPRHEERRPRAEDMVSDQFSDESYNSEDDR